MATDGRSLDRALGEHVVIDSTNIPAGVVIQSDIGSNSIDGGKLDSFQSTEITGTGSEQNIAHGLSTTPTFVVVTVTEDTGTAGSLSIVEGTHDGTNVKVDAPSTIKFKVKAL